jgi:hypothetical protein
VPALELDLSCANEEVPSSLDIGGELRGAGECRCSYRGCTATKRPRRCVLEL